MLVASQKIGAPQEIEKSRAPVRVPSAHQRRQSKRPDPPIGYTQLMEASEARLLQVSRSDVPAQSLVAGRIFENPKDFVRWEREHAGLMRAVSRHQRRDRQINALLGNSLSLVHRKAPFEFLREHHVTGLMRHRLIRLLHGHNDYTQSMVAEHGRYLRTAASLICTAHIGSALLFEDVFDEPLLRYERLYGGYFRVYCESALQAEDADGDRATATSVLLPILKLQLTQWRNGLYARIRPGEGAWQQSEIKVRKLKR